MLDNRDYRSRWKRKLEKYRDGGILPADEGGGLNGSLMYTDDLAGVDEPKWAELAYKVIGPVSAAPTTPRKKVKKTPPGTFA